MTTAILAFFLVGIIGTCYGLDPFISCKRGAIAMVGTYIVASLVIHIINAILLDALISKQIEKMREKLTGE